MELIVHQSISDLYRALHLPIEQDLEFTIHFLPDIHPTIPFRSPVFRAEYFSFVFIKDGKGTYTTDEQMFPTVPGTIYFTNPGHIKAFQIDELRDAYIITLTETFLKENVHANIFLEFPFLLAETVPPKVLDPDDFAEFEAIYLQLFKEFNKQSTYKNRILGNLFVVLLLKIKEQFWQDYNPIEEGDRHSQIVRAFKKKLEEHYLKANIAEGIVYNLQIADFADALHLHPNYLNQLIKSKTGKTVHQWITDKAISQAKSLLKNTSLSAKEIAHRLGYSEATHFSRFFKKHAKMTPSAYRKK